MAGKNGGARPGGQLSNNNLQTRNQMRPQDFDVHELIESLQGTCTTIEEHLPEGMEWEDLTDEDHTQIDLEIFRCEECGWWHEISDMAEDENDEHFCKDCRPQDDE